MKQSYKKNTRRNNQRNRYWNFFGKKNKRMNNNFSCAFLLFSYDTMKCMNNMKMYNVKRTQVGKKDMVCFNFMFVFAVLFCSSLFSDRRDVNFLLFMPFIAIIIIIIIIFGHFVFSSHFLVVLAFCVHSLIWKILDIWVMLKLL